MESQPQNPEFRIIPQNFHPCIKHPSLAQVVLQGELIFLSKSDWISTS